jgi:hypothetical protein
MRWNFSFLILLFFAPAAAASPCIVFDPDGDPYFCGRGSFTLSLATPRAHEPIILSFDLTAVAPVSDLSSSSTFQDFHVTSSSESPGLQFVFNGYFISPGTFGLLAFFTDGFGNPGCVGAEGPGCTPLIVNVLDQAIATAVPEPSSWALMLFGFIAAALFGRSQPCRKSAVPWNFARVARSNEIDRQRA